MPDLTNLINDLDYLLNPPTFRILGQSDLNDIEHNTAKDVELDDASGTRHTEWDPTGVVTNGDMAVNGARLEVGDADAGIWLVGGAAHITQGIPEGQRSFKILKGAEELVGHTDNPDWSPGATHWAHTSIQDFAAGEYFGMQVKDELNRASLSPISRLRSSNYALPAAAWGCRVADTTSNSDTYDSVDWSPAENPHPIDWWNDVVTALNRRGSRPAAGIRVGSGGFATVGSWNEVAYSTTEFSNTTGMVSGSRLVAPEKGWYYVTFGVEVQNPDLQRGQIVGRVILNEGTGSEFPLDFVANTPTDYRDDKNVILYGESIIRLDANETVGVFAQTFTGGVSQAYAGGGPAIIASGNSHLRMVLVSSQTSIPNQQIFDSTSGGIPDLSLIDFTNYTYLNKGLATLLSRDVLGHLVKPPVISMEMSSDATISAGGYGAGHQWRRLPLNFYEFNSWEGNFKPAGRTGIQVPLRGLWLVNLRATMLDTVDRFDPQSSDDSNQFAGNVGKRGLRIELNDEVVAQLVSDPMLHPTHNWNRTTTTLVVAEEGDVLNGSAMHTAEDTLTMPGRGRSDILGDVRLSAVWLGATPPRNLQAQSGGQN